MFIVSANPARTLELILYRQYFFERAGRDGSRFIAIPIRGSRCQHVAEQDKFRKIFTARQVSGAAISALDFCMERSAAIWDSAQEILRETPKRWSKTCQPCVAGRIRIQA